MAGFNKIILIGRLTKNPEIRLTTTDIKVSNFTLAVDRNFKKENQENKTDFIPVTSFGKSAEFVEQYLRKGMQIMVEGRLQIDNWQDENGQWHNKSYVVSSNIVFLEKKKDPADEYQEKYLKDINEVENNIDEPFGDIPEIKDDDFPQFFPVDEEG
ncbi:hypothetical protein XO10_00535 [Marinitoga sp. 1135]|uniref:single-stranded DNA-binding protein n=1 Tax=Marinitoga sp. 1135 TaxID=1643333 RepID=UPI0015864E60|nr:single-stranded DNA-binding protein [Marinitoga sp. 1135]NUU94807.1 hypothetical protein [Marinitoga sp. 1135]